MRRGGCASLTRLCNALARAEGNATISLGGDASLTVDASHPGYSAVCGCGRATVALSPAVGLSVTVRGFDPQRPLRGLSLVPAELESTWNTTGVFSPRLVALMQGLGAVAAPGYRGPLLRFSGWGDELAGSEQSGGGSGGWLLRCTLCLAAPAFSAVTFAPYSSVASWGDRALASAWGITPAGVPLEHMAALVRATAAPAAWFSVPQGAAGAAAVAGGASFLRNLTRLLVDELLAGAVADALAAAAGGGPTPLPAGWQAMAPGLSTPVQLPAAAPGSAAALAARNLSTLVIQYSNELNFFPDAATATAQVGRGGSAG